MTYFYIQYIILGMIDKSIRNQIIKMYTKKDDKIFIGNLFDIINQFENSNRLCSTNFLNLYEQNIAVSILNRLNIKFIKSNIIEDVEKNIFFLIPKYVKENIDKTDICSLEISCIKVTAKNCNLLHKDYMGAIYNLGINGDMIGDIFLINNVCYIFIKNEVLDFVLNNLEYVGKIKVSVEKLNLRSDEIYEIKQEYQDLKLVTSSLRIDNLLNEISNLGRSKVKEKIENGDLVINSQVLYFPAYTLKINDIISFSKVGKFKIEDIQEITKNGKKRIHVKKYKSS